MTPEQKYLKYLELVEQAKDRYGWIQTAHCDALLFTGLLGCLPEQNPLIMAGFDFNTRTWRRRPVEWSCYDCKNDKPSGARSSISRDMLLGLAWYAWYNKELWISEQVIEYAIRNLGFMGCGDMTATNIMPALFSTFCWISYKLGGPSRSWARWIPADAGAKLDGFQAHLQALHIMLRQRIGAPLTDREKRALEYQAKRSPRNPLFQIAVGNYEKATDTLMDSKLWPEDRLPTSDDRYTEWLPMRDDDDDWLPDTGAARITTHSGGDFLFCAWLLRHSVK